MKLLNNIAVTALLHLGLARCRAELLADDQQQCQSLAHASNQLFWSASMVDPTIKLLLTSSPKAGATLVEKLMLARLNLTGAAINYGGYPLHYSHEVFQKQKGRMPTEEHLNN